METWRLAIQRLDELAPAKAQARIIEDMLQPASRVDDATLALLPPEATRGLTPWLIQAAAGAPKLPARQLAFEHGTAGAVRRRRIGARKQFAFRLTPPS